LGVTISAIVVVIMFRDIYIYIYYIPYRIPVVYPTSAWFFMVFLCIAKYTYTSPHGAILWATEKTLSHTPWRALTSGPGDQLHTANTWGPGDGHPTRGFAGGNVSWWRSWGFFPMGSCDNHVYMGGFLKWWYPTTTKNDHFVVFWGYHHLRKHPETTMSPQNHGR